jgi:ribose transport system substrate-binding protein
MAKAAHRSLGIPALLIALVALVFLAPRAFTQSKTYTIAVIPKGTTHPYWKGVKAGADKAAVDFGVTIVWKGPLLENDRAQQIAIVEQLASQGVDAIVLAPLDNVALRRPVREAMDNHIPVVIIDSALEGEAGKDYVSFVATDNHHGGELAGQKLVDLLGGHGKVVLLRYGEGSASTLEREAGFLDVMTKNPGIQMLVTNRYAGPTIGDAKDTAMQMSDDLSAADGIFASNESASAGMLLALRQLGLAGKVKFVGFDTDTMLLGALRNGQIQGLVAQNPSKMAYLGVEQAVNALKGQPVTLKIDSGCALITPDNIDDPSMAEYMQVK